MHILRSPLVPFAAACVLALPAAAMAQSACDQDGDGSLRIVCGGADCDDNDARRFPGAVEVCDADGVDEDCDPSTPGFRDLDGDGFNSSACFNRDFRGITSQGDDCNDTNPAVHIIAAELCNGQDDNCDGSIDEGVQVPMYVDNDGDGFGTGAPLFMCPFDSGYAPRAGDCDDDNAAIVPGAQICQGPDVLVCTQQGTYAQASCQRRARCHDQPNGTGICECRRGTRRNGNCR